MKTAKKQSWLRNLLVAVCAVLGCILFVLGALPKGVFATGDEGSGTVEEKQYELREISLKKKDGFAFTSGLTDEQKFNLVEVSVTYAEVLEEGSEAVPETKTETLVLTGGGSIRTAETGETVTFSFAANTITASVTPRDGYTASAELADGTLEVVYEAQKLSGITAQYIGTGALTISSKLNASSDFRVYWTYNDGTTGEELQGVSYEFNDYSLFPDQFPVSGPYSKEVGIILTANAAAQFGVERFSTTATVNNIEFSDPTKITAIVGNSLPKQYARSALDYGNVAATFRFGSGLTAANYNVPLNVLRDTGFITPSYYNSSLETVDDLTTAVKYCTINIDYRCSDGTVLSYDGSDTALTVEVEEIPLIAPTFPSQSLINYYNGVSIDVTGLDFSGQFEKDPPKPVVTVETVGSADDYVMTDGGDACNIEFKKPGIGYTVVVKLPENGDFQWNTPSAPAVLVDKYTIKYTVQVNKGNWDITLSGDFSWVYGESSPMGTVKGDLQGTDANENETFGFTSNIPTGNVVNLEYHLEFSADGSNWSAAVPADAGKYQTRAVSHETEFYNSAVSNVLDVTISPKLLNAQDFVEEVTYDRAKSYNGADMLKKGSVGGIAVSSLNITVTESDGVSFPVKYYKDDAGYGIVLTLGNKNYTFKAIPEEWNTVDDLSDCRADAANFLIKKREIKYSVYQSDFYYGAGSGSTFSANLQNSADAVYVGEPVISYTGAGKTYSSREKIDEWNANDGNYTVQYTPTYAGADAQEENSLVLKLASDTFKINKAQVVKVSLSDNSVEYDPAGREFTVSGATGFAAGGLGKYADLSAVRKGLVSGTRADFTAINFSLGTEGATVSLLNADVYTVTLTLADTTNFVWTGGGGNPTATWTIVKKALDEIVKPTDDITYDHAEHVLTLANWDKAVMTQSVSGKSASGAAIVGAFDEENGTFALTKAGTYSFTFTLKDASNYEWKNNTASTTLKFDFVLKQATAALLNNTAETDFNDASKPLFEIPKAKMNTAAGGELTGLSFIFTVTNESGAQVATNATIVGKKVDASGVYTYTITGFAGEEADNYVMPAGGLTFTFNVKSQNLVIPTFGADNKLEYNGAEQSVLNFITNYAAQNYGERIVITIKKGETVLSSGSDPKVKNVYLVGNAVTAYSVTVAPAPNYKWNIEGTSYSENEEFSFEFTLMQFGLTVTWDSDTLFTVYGNAAAPKYSLDKFGADDVAVAIGYRDGVSVPTDAGNYSVYATGLSGSAKDNYDLKTNPDTRFTVRKQTIAKPLQNGAAYEGTFGAGTESVNLYSNQNAFDHSLLSAAVAGYRPAEWFDDKTQQTLTIGTQTYFDIATGKFHYIDAGFYNVTFTIGDGANYCWVGENAEDFSTTVYTHTWNDFAKIARQELTAPAFGNFRAQEWGTFDGTKLAVPSQIDGVAVTVQYGTRSGEGFVVYEKDLSDAVKGGNTADAIGQYYVIVSVRSGADICNYVWGDSADGQKPFVFGTDTKLYGAGQVAIRLHYAITSTQLPLNFENIAYTFGDNGIVNGTTILKNFFAALKLQADGSLEKLQAAGMDWNETDISFVEGSVKFYSDGEIVTDLENELPWNVGNYAVTFDIRFSDSNYQNLHMDRLPVTVSPRALELDWSNLSKIYNGTDELGTAAVATVTMKNVPERSGGAIALPTPVVAAREGSAKDAGNYNLYVSEITGDNAANFTADGAKNSYGSVTESTADVPFEITKYAFTATGKNVADHVYGDTLPSGPDDWTVTNDSKPRPEGFDEDIKSIVLSIMQGASSFEKPSVGDYTISLAWSSAEAGKNYRVTFVDTATFKVVAREIEVALSAKEGQTLSGNALSGVYFADASNYTITDYRFAVTHNGSADGAIIAGDHPFALRSAVTQSSAVNAVGYPITIKVTDNNYKVTVLGTKYEKSETATETGYVHKILNAALMPTVAENAGGTYNANPYVYLTTHKVKGSTNADLTAAANNAQWFIFKAEEKTAKPDKDAAGWEPYNENEKHFGKDAGKYYFFVKIEAKNHETVVVSAAENKPFAFEIAKAKFETPNGIRSGDLVYKAEAYTYLTDTHNVSGVNLGENRPTWSIGTAGSESATADGVSWIEYAVGTHSRTNVGTDYFFVKITAANHEDLIVSNGGKPFRLNIKQATLALFANMSIFFNEENPAVAGYYQDGGAVTVEKLKQGYADGIFLIDENNGLLGEDALATLAGLAGSFTYSVNYTKGVSGVGSGYTIKLNVDGLSSDNYAFAAKDGVLEVKALPVSATISADSALTAVYGSTGLLMPVAVVKSEQKSTYGAENIDISDLAVADIVTVNTEALVSGEGGYTTNNVGKYDITLIFGSDFELVAGGYTTVQFEITPAENRITTENYTLFHNADSWKDGSAEKNAAWVYGKFADDGYKADGDHRLQAFALLSRANDLKITLAFNGTSKEITVASEEDIQSALTQLFAQWAAFNAGSYTVTYQMNASQNYKAFREVWNFAVAKRSITVTPDEKSVVYGDPFTGEFTYEKSSELDGYGDAREDIAQIIADFRFGTVKDGAAAAYAAGWNFGTYAIKVLIDGALANYDGDAYEHETDNYVFTFGTSDFSVTAREVTITIRDAENHYMLVGTYHDDTKKYDLESWATLGYKLTAGSLFGDEVPFEFYTTALIDSKTTKAVGKYAIYAVYKDEIAKSNYSVVIGNDRFDGDVDQSVLKDTDENLLVKNNGVLFGGVFSIEKAVLHAERSGPYFKDPNGTAEFGGEKYTLYASSSESMYVNTYDGREKYYFATTNVDRDDLKALIPTFTPAYTQLGNTAFSGVPKNVGTYRVSFVPDVGNSNFADLSVGGGDIYINARPLGVTPSTSSDTERVYNGNPYTVTFTFAPLVGEEVLGLSVTVNDRESDGSFSVIKPSAGSNRNVLTVSATRAGTYRIKALLEGDGMKNYSLSGGLYEYDLIIKSSGLFVVVQNATIEYGTPLSPNSLFKVAYSLTNDKATETDPALLALIESNMNGNAFTKPENFRFNVGADGNRYSDGLGGAASKATSTFGVTIDNIFSDNYTVTVIAGELEVVQRKINVNVYGVADNGANRDIAHNVYDGNDHSAGAGGSGAFKKNFEDNKTKYLELASGFSFGNSGMTIGNLGAMLTIPTAVEAGRYPISAADVDPNFEISFRYNGAEITDSNRPRYQIDHRELIAKVQGAGTNYTGTPSTVNVVYGNEAVQSLFTVCYSGWVAGQESLANGRGVRFVIGDESDKTNVAKTYVTYGSQVGQTYQIAINGLPAGTETFKNYNLKLVDATLAITPRPIGASTQDRTFAPDTENYHGGAWGLPLEAQIAFTNVDSQDRLKGGYSLSYNTKADSLGQTASTAPVKVGGYTVTVTLTANSYRQYNYTFSESDSAVRTCELNYNILKRQVNLLWDSNTVNEVKTVILTGGFVADVMDVVSFTVGDNAVSEADYSATNEGLNIAVGSVNGVYTITIALKSTAAGNYQLVENVTGTMTPVEQRVTSFTVALGSNQTTRIEFITDGMGSWIYSEDAKEPKAQVKLTSSGALVSGAVVMFDYVVATAPEGTQLDRVYTSVDGWYDNTQWSAVVSNAGRYLVRARYAGQTSPDVYYAAEPVYYYFEIAKKELNKPVIKDAESYVYAEKNGSGSIEGEIENYLASAMQIVSAGVQASLADGVMKLFATGKGEYAIRIALTDSANYVWADDKSTDNVDLVWAIRPADDNTMAWNDSLSTVAYAENYSLAANPQKYSYNINVAYAYTARAEGETNPDANARWTMGLPVNAGKYWVRATGSSPEGNYNTATVDRAFEITKVVLTLDPSGSMVYGDTFSGTDYSMNVYTVIRGLVNGDTEQMLMRDLKNIEYTVTDAPESGLWQVRNYSLTMSAEATNYTIESLTGTFTVNKERLYVTIGNNAQSLYKRELNLSAATVSLRGVVQGDDEAALIAELKTMLVTDATSSSDADRYEIRLSASELANYALSVTNGVYTINKLPVRVEADWGGYEYGTAAVLPSVTGVYDGAVKLALTEEELAGFLFVYAGSDGVPTAAGEHIVSVYVAGDSNYALATPVSGLFVIRQTVLDADLIVWEVVYFDTVIKKPEVDYIKDDAFARDMFEIDYIGEWNRAGVAYTIELTLKRPESTKWKSVEGAVRTLTYTVSRGFNALVDGIEIEGWVYGDYSESNLPTANAKFGTVTFEYSNDREEGYTTAAPVGSDAGEYWVRAVVEGTSDYERFVSSAVKFEITPKAISAPTLNIITEGYGQNNVYTGVAMQADVLNYDSTLMYIRYEEGTMIVNGNLIKVIATNAGTYYVTVTLVNGNNYIWSEGTSLDESGNALLSWTISRKKLAAPTHNDATLIVNGQELAYYPVGFDSSIMKIENNTSGYGGTFTATVSLIDTDNYEWADGSTESLSFEWHVVGADTVFIAVISVLSALVCAAAVVGGVQGFFYYKKKKAERQKAQQNENAKEGV